MRMLFFYIIFFGVANSFERKVDEIVDDAIARHIFPGAQIVVGACERLQLSKMYGTFTYDDQAAPVTENTLFDLASLAKIISTTMMTMLLYEEGKLHLDDLVKKYIPLFSGEEKDTIAIKDLLTHVSGLQPDEKPDQIQKDAAETNAAAVLRHIAQLPLVCAPRTKVIYSCLNFYLLAHINEKVAGEKQEDFVRRRVLEPLGMHASYHLTDEQRRLCAPTAEDLQGIVHDPLARFYGLDDGTPGNAGIFSTGSDLVPFCEMILNDGAYRGRQILKPETVALMTHCYTQELGKRRGLGLNILDEYPHTTHHMRDDNPETYIVGHTGYTGTMLWLDLLKKMYVLFLTNRVYPDEKSSVVSTRETLLRTILQQSYPKDSIC